MSDVFVRCGNCKHYITELEELRAEDELNDPELGHLGHCDAVDTTSLPYTWRWATREVMGAWSLELIRCPAFVAINTEEKSDEPK
jgi:hypothetical protein